MKLPSFIEKQLVKLVLKRSGPYIQKLITLAAAAGAAALAKQIPGLEAIITPELLGLVLWVVLDAVVTNLPGEILTKYGKEIQSTYNAMRPKAYLPPLKEDGFVGPLTVRSVNTELLIGQEPQPPPQQ
jgi:hypothetical protein